MVAMVRGDGCRRALPNDYDFLRLPSLALLLRPRPAAERRHNNNKSKGFCMNEAAQAPVGREIPIEFRASGGEYFRIWIVNLLLTIITFGIYSAWAKVRRLRYFYGSTALDGSSFEYHGRPIAILKGRLIALFVYLLIVILGQINPVINLFMAPLIIFGLPWIIMRSRLFQMRMSSWRGLRFNFHGRYGGSLAAFIGWPILAVLTIGALYPLAMWKQVKYLLQNNAFGTQRFAFLTRIGSFYRFCLIGVAVAIGVFAAIAGLVSLLFGSMSAAQSLATNGVDPTDLLRILLSGKFLLSLLVYAAGLMLITAYFRSRMLNASIGGVQVGPHRVYSRLALWPMFFILATNLLAMIVTLGLFYPWAKVRSMRYQFANTGVIASGDLNQFVAEANQGVSAIGEEVSDIFDIDFGF
jgi:uncharacterized membrane protein YjgN (DUF898 family)